MPDYKHVGRVKTNQRKVIVAYRVVPGDPENCLVVQTENLNAEEHDSLLKLVESDAGQNAYEFAEAMARARLPDGRNMLAGFHATGKLNKVPANLIEMMPNRSTVINLAELNEVIANQKGVTVADLAIKGPNGETVPVQNASTPAAIDPVTMYSNDMPNSTQATSDGILTDDALAAQLRSQADAMFKEAKRLREQAEELVPTKKKVTKAASETA
jgi:hypothetical protein